MQRNTLWTIRLLVPGLALGALILGISAGLGDTDNAEAQDRAAMPVAAEYLSLPLGPMPVEEVAARSGSSRSTSSSSTTSSSTTSSSTSSSSNSGSSSACGPESPCLNGKAVGHVLQKLLKQLNLSSTQASQIDTILQGERAAIMKVIAALKASAGDNPSQSQLDAAKTQINALQLKDRAAIDKILTTDQLNQLTALEKQYCACNQGQSGSGSGGKNGKDSGGKDGKDSGGKCGGQGSHGSGPGSGGDGSGGTATATPTPTPSDATSV